MSATNSENSNISFLRISEKNYLIINGDYKKTQAEISKHRYLDDEYKINQKDILGEVILKRKR